MNLEGLSEELFPVHQKRLVKQLIDKVTVHADRLDIGRVGIQPDSKYLFTTEAKRIADQEDFEVLNKFKLV